MHNRQALLLAIDRQAAVPGIAVRTAFPSVVPLVIVMIFVKTSKIVAAIIFQSARMGLLCWRLLVVPENQRITTKRMIKTGTEFLSSFTLMA